MVNLKISATLREEIIASELDRRIEREPESLEMDVYRRIANAQPTRKDGSMNIDVTDAELDELYAEATYSGDPSEACDPQAGYIKAWAALARQIRRVR